MVGVERGVGRETKKEKRKKRMSKCIHPIIRTHILSSIYSDTATYDVLLFFIR